MRHRAFSYALESTPSKIHEESGEYFKDESSEMQAGMINNSVDEGMFEHAQPAQQYIALAAQGPQRPRPRHMPQNNLAEGMGEPRRQMINDLPAPMARNTMPGVYQNQPIPNVPGQNGPQLPPNPQAPAPQPIGDANPQGNAQANHA